MKIAQVAPLFESVPPRFYGGTERIVSYLTEELVGRGHEVTLFATGDSKTAGKLVACWPEGLRLMRATDPILPHVLALEQVYGRAEEFDIIHFHVEYLHFLSLRNASVPHLTTVHNRLDLPLSRSLYHCFNGSPLVSISRDQRNHLPFVNWFGSVHHGLPENLLPFQLRGDGYLAFLGRASPEKGLDRAIEIARRTRHKIRVAAKIDQVDLEYFYRHVQPLLAEAHVDFIGEISESQKPEFLGRAKALLFPVDWPEPFGLVMIEAMACGTPVIAFDRGSVREIVLHGHTGYIVDSVEEAAHAVNRLGAIDRWRCRRHFMENFLASHMADNYLNIFKKVIKWKKNWIEPSRLRASGTS
ncbi:MAG: glycosyl transferase [Bdellovibrio sp.]|nr:MAG: glycosyl transferase [Bdellovibrio sp.]